MSWVAAVALLTCCEYTVRADSLDIEMHNHHHYAPRVDLLKPTGFSVTIEDARDIRQLHIFWNYRKPYNRTNPYSTTDYTNVTFNDNYARSITVADTDVQLRIGDSIFYWLLLITKDWERITLHKQNFWVKFDQNVWDGVPEPFSETYYRDFDKYHLNDEL
uniref:CBM39 domain-containing protein n=1 Tax=Graphocephala atropunctata TaxID=36148 RepID=A0A1B6MA23_9HEMI